MVASIVVLPLICDGQTFVGFYVTLETTSNFQNIKDLLMGFVNSVVLVLQKRLYPQRELIWDAIMSVSARRRQWSCRDGGEAAADSNSG